MIDVDIRVDVWWSIVILTVWGLMCVWALLPNRYHVNWFHMAGLVGSVFWVQNRVFDLYERTSEVGTVKIVTVDGTVSFDQFMIHVSLLIFALGEVWRVWRNK